MSGEHYSFELVDPLPGDELLLIRDRQGRRTTVDRLPSGPGGNSSDSAIAYSETPPDDKALWWQMADGLPVDFWMLRPGGLWVSNEVIRVSSYTPVLSSGKTYKNPLPDRKLWVDTYSLRGLTEDAIPQGKKWRFDLCFVNSLNQQIPYYFLELEGLGANEVFDISEFVGEAVPVDNAFSLWHKISRVNSAPRVRNCTVTANIRRLWYAPS